MNSIVLFEVLMTVLLAGVSAIFLLDSLILFCCSHQLVLEVYSKIFLQFDFHCHVRDIDDNVVIWYFYHLLDALVHFCPTINCNCKYIPTSSFILNLIALFEILMATLAGIFAILVFDAFALSALVTSCVWKSTQRTSFNWTLIIVFETLMSALLAGVSAILSSWCFDTVLLQPSVGIGDILEDLPSIWL